MREEEVRAPVIHRFLGTFDLFATIMDIPRCDPFLQSISSRLRLLEDKTDLSNIQSLSLGYVS